MNYRKLTLIGILPTIALVLAIAAFVFHLSPCNIASAQIVCDSTTNELFSNNLRVDGEINIGSTPVPGELGQVLEGTRWFGSGWNYVYKTVDETVNNSTTLQSDDELTFAFDAGDKYLVEIFLRATSDTNADLNIFIPHATLIGGYIQNCILCIDYDTIVDNIISFVSYNGRQVTVIKIAFTPVSGGNWDFQWAQRTAHASNTTVFAGSFLRYIKIEDN